MTATATYHLMRSSREQALQWSQQFDRDGYIVVRGLMSPDEVAAIRDKFDAIGAEGKPIPGYWEPRTGADADPLARFPRVMHPHRFNDLSKRMMLHAGVHDVLAAAMGEEPVACQSMFYFKPPGAKGQALHQDNFYLRVSPGTCVAAWTAIDPAVTSNGGLYVVPGSHRMDIVCPEAADARESFTTHLVKAPAGMKAVPADLQPGDVLFFNGSLIHGSGPNRSATQWRRSFICHYMPASTTHVSEHYFPIFDFTGREISYAAATGGGPCGELFPDKYDPIH